jgi:ATP-dependent DNA helicase PIF1
VQLTAVYRQSDERLIRLVDQVFMGQLTSESVEMLRWLQRPLDVSHEPHAVRLCFENRAVDMWNRERLEEHSGDLVPFRSEDWGAGALLTQVPVPALLCLKVGAPVMLLRNIDLTRGLVNGARGEVLSLSHEAIHVQFPCGPAIICQHTFCVFDPQKGTVGATRRQFPLRLAYALTVHKAQGLELPAVVIDARDMRRPGMFLLTMAEIQVI